MSRVDKRYSAEYKNDFLRRFEESGMALISFCESEEVTYKTAYKWIQGPGKAEPNFHLVTDKNFRYIRAPAK